MGLREDIALMELKLNAAIGQVMENEVADLAKEAMQEAVQTQVYDAYSPIEYHRRRTEDKGLQDKRVMKQRYDPATRTLTLENTSTDSSRPSRKVAEMIEEGKGYRMHNQKPFPRPFHKETEEIMGDGLMELALAQGLSRKGYVISK